MHALIDLYAYVDSVDVEMSALVISKDQFHKEVLGEPKVADQLYRALSFYRPDERIRSIDMPIHEGRAVTEGIGVRDVRIDNLIVETDSEGNPEKVESTVYVNALGDLIPSCDMSFESQEENKIGNVHDNTIAEILDREVSKTAMKAA
jgi:hypothetical protein